MRERPIIFSAPMVRAILDGTKTQTRRIVKSPARTMQREGMEVIKHRAPGDPWYGDHVWSMRNRMGVWGDYTHEQFLSLCPYGIPGDRLWVREAHALSTGHMFDGEAAVRYRADDAIVAVSDERTNSIARWRSMSHWRPSIHMPRWASRILLEITEVRVQRLQEISEEDAKAEGVTLRENPESTFRDGFKAIWCDINGPRSWGANPWCWVLTFRRISTT